MRRTLVIVLTIVTFCNVRAQKQLLTQTIKGESQINIALDEVKNEFTPPPERDNLLKSGSSAGNFIVSYENVPAEAIAAFQYAISIWEGFISSPLPIKIKVKWEEHEKNMLAQSKPTQFYKNFDGALFSNVYYPVALAEKLAGKDLNGENEPDIICSFNSNISWYFDTDGNTPSKKYDFVTAVLHEITHGLGFSGFLKAEDENGFLNNSSNLPSIYDYYVYNYNNLRIADNNNFESPSIALFYQLTSEQLKFNKETVTEKSATPAPNLYAPDNWVPGSSLYHLDNSALSNNENSLMTAYKYKGQAVHTPGDITIQMLAEMGWKSVSFDFTVIKDFEETCKELPISLGINSEIPFQPESVKLIFSKDYFTSSESIDLTYDASSQKYITNLPVDNHLGNIQYYFVAQFSDGKTYKLPSTAPNKKLNFRIGPDYSAPTVQHNPVKLISSSLKYMNLKGKAEDNLGVKSVKVEFKIDGISQEPVYLNIDSEDVFSGSVELPDFIKGDDNIEYRIIADDKSKNCNKIIVPTNGYFSIEVFEPKEAVTSYETDFNNFSEDFIGSDFKISELDGFSNGVLHTNHPYEQSKIENEKYNLVSQLKYPIVINNQGKMSFKEVVLVEPGEAGTTYNELLFWDYVIVEASKDNGKTWIPLTEGYDSNNDQRWYSCFTNSLKSISSAATGNESLFVNRTINLTENTGLQEGDIIIIRFRLSSDNSVNGWGWAIDDLKIQTESFDFDEIANINKVDVYPNPFSDNFYVDCSNTGDISEVDILVTDLAGKTVFREIWTDPQFTFKKQVNLNSIKPGIYLVNMITDASEVITKKIVKY